MTAEAVRTDTPANKLSILIFDDGATFEYVEEIASEFLEVSTCRSFADLADYLVAVSSGERVSPDILALDLYCDDYNTFDLLGVSMGVDPATCGLQLLQHVLPRYLPGIDDLPVVLFSSYPEKIKDLRTEKASRSRNGALLVCDREDFARSFRQIIIDSKIWSNDEVDERLPRDINQEEYLKLFNVLAKEFQMDDAEQRKFLEAVGEDVEISTIFQTTRIANKRVDQLLEVSMGLDEFLTTESKRRYLESTDLGWKDLSCIEGLLEEPSEGLPRLARRIEQVLGGRIL
ncbi:hypothetical protein [Salipiger profundus]|uniref:hypothetical protein n=1 Tax=Salipiger profundus TaxID=1229727 RepID=UPI0012FFC21E|nr:hypothetical protein [Salipiger profundus]GGA28759.1 hypothetical protein GCM10011326_46000 [Salipiger profundus]|tara:strand:- start:74 stop:937 length:864 start_codon:yes stop_codon:yes gene_type:complete